MYSAALHSFRLSLFVIPLVFQTPHQQYPAIVELLSQRMIDTNNRPQRHQISWGLHLAQVGWEHSNLWLLSRYKAKSDKKSEMLLLHIAPGSDFAAS